MNPRKLQIKEGHYYARKDGSVHGPMKRDDDPSLPGFCWYCEDSDRETSETFTISGCYHYEGPSDKDLVREVPAPHAKAAKAKARKRKAVPAFLVHYFNNGRPQDGILVARMSSMKNAIEYCKNMTLNNYTCGPITKISIPAPTVKKGK